LRMPTRLAEPSARWLGVSIVSPEGPAR